MFNCGPKPRDLAVQLESTLSLPCGTYTVRDLWAHQNIPATSRAIPLTVPSHGARLLKITRA